MSAIRLNKYVGAAAVLVVLGGVGGLAYHNTHKPKPVSKPVKVVKELPVITASKINDTYRKTPVRIKGTLMKLSDRYLIVDKTVTPNQSVVAYPSNASLKFNDHIGKGTIVSDTPVTLTGTLKSPSEISGKVPQGVGVLFYATDIEQEPITRKVH